MRIRLLSLNTDSSMSFAKFQARIVSSIKAYSEEQIYFESFGNMRDTFNALQNALQNDELIITAVDTNNYNKFKQLFISALGDDVQYNPNILNMLEANAGLDDKERKEISAFPASATVFLSKDGYYSGFGIENGSQYVALIPIDNDRINLILRNGLIPFLSNNIKIVDGNEAFFNENKLFDDEKVKVAVKRLIDTESIVAVNGTPNAEILKSCGDSVPRFDEVFVFTPYVEDKGEVNATEYAAQLAKVSLDLSAANIGASISDIYTAGESKYICVAVANEASAIVRKLYMSEDESEDAFIQSAAVELIELIGEKAIGAQSVGIEIAENDSSDNIMPDDVKGKANKKAVIIWSVVLSIILVACAALGIVYKIQGENGALANVFKSVFGTNPSTTTQPPVTDSITQPESTEQAVTPQADKIVKISDFIALELLNNQKEETEPTETETAITGEEEPSTEKIQGAPEFITVNGQKLPAKEALAKLVMTEMGEGYGKEAIKAQTVAIYTFLKYRNNDFVIDGVQISDNYNEEVMTAVNEVFGEYLTYNNEIALTPFFNVAAGKTASALDVLGKDYPYLKSVSIKDDPDSKHSSFKQEKEYNLGEMKSFLLDYDSSLKLAEEPEKWITVSKHDASVSSAIGYITRLYVGGKEITGIQFRKDVLGLEELKSHCFMIDFDKTTGIFKISSYGDGIGVGMSKAGANALAEKNNDYKKILSTYYKGTKLSKEANI